MSGPEILLLGAIAGFTVFLGLPIGRMRNLDRRLTTLLSSVATGILLFLIWDVLTHATAPIETAIDGDEWGTFAGLALVFAAGVSIGLAGLAYYERWMLDRYHDEEREVVAVGAAGGPTTQALSPAAHLSLLIAIGIGLHNFSEGLAIGQSAAAGELSLAYALIIGFGLHNATEGFGIIGPMAGKQEVPRWGYLFMLGLIGGGPTFVGTAIGQAWVNDYVATGFLALAAGSILFVVNELLHLNYSANLKLVVVWGLLIGLFAGFATDWILVAAGA